MNIISVKSTDQTDDAHDVTDNAMADDNDSPTAAEDSNSEDKGLGQELEEEEDFDEGISDISTKDTIINPSGSNARYRGVATFGILDKGGGGMFSGHLQHFHQGHYYQPIWEQCQVQWFSHFK
jgi:hypothetical protein